jgi:hypothetical protein
VLNPPPYGTIQPFYVHRNAPSTPAEKIAWPKTMREQIAAVRTFLSTSPQTSAQLASRFRRSPALGIQAVLGALEELGMLEEENGTYSLISNR